MDTFYRASTEYVHVPVARDDDAVITGDTVTMAILASANTQPVLADYLTAAWTTIDGTVMARTLVDFSTLAAGVYAVWVHVAHSPETMVRPAGFIRVV